MTDELKPLRPGHRAPVFTLEAANRDGTVSLADYPPTQAVLLGLFRGLHCPFCRRQVFQLGTVQPALAALGVETIVVMNTPAERARLYFRHHATRIVLLADPAAATHRAFAVPSQPLPNHLPTALAGARLNPTGELPQPLPAMDALAALNTKDGFEPTDADQKIFAGTPAQLVGHFLIDRDGLIRWTNLEASEGLNGIGTFPTPAELLATTKSLVGSR